MEQSANKNRVLAKIGTVLDALGDKISENHLIVFDKKSLCFMITLVFMFIILVVSKTHYSSIAMWDKIVPGYDAGKTSSKVLFGSPKFIRMDEWRLGTPFILSQEAKNYPTENYSFGPGKTPVLMGLPARHFSIFFKPQYWGFFMLDLERGYSYFWNFSVISLVLSSFLLFMLLTNSIFWLSIFGALFLFFSSFTQWWFYASLGVMLSAFNAMLVGFIYLVSSKKRLTIIISAIILFLFTINFSLTLYPPFQVPLGLLLIACCTGYFSQYSKWDIIKQHLNLRFFLLLLCFFALVTFICFFYFDLKDTIAITMKTAYPGKRISCGGEFGIDRFFSGFYGLFFNENKFIWMNVCETSSFLFLFPAIIIMVIINTLKRRFEPLQIALSVYLVLLTLFIVVGFLPVFSKLTLLSFVPSRRAIIGVGVGNILLTVVYLSSTKNAINLTLVKNLALFVSLIFCFLAYGLCLNEKTNHFFQSWQISAVSIFFPLIICLLLNHKKLLFCLSVLFVVVLSTYSVLPVSQGLGFITDKKLYHTVKTIVSKDSVGKWLVYGSALHSGFITAAGANVFSGTKYNPDISAMKILDPSGKRDSIYNRFANIAIVNRPEDDKVGFKLFYEDFYGIAISPFSEKLKDLGIKYLLMPDDTTYYNIEQGKSRGVAPVFDKPIDKFWVLEIKSNTRTAGSISQTSNTTIGKRIF
jgi:hypothetical protein